MTTVMVVDDSEVILMSVSGILTKNKMTAVTAKNGQDALGKLGAGKPNLIITDLNMPQMDGITFIQKAKALPGMRFVPILMLTTESDTAKRAQAKAAGATGWLVKPVGAEQLIGVIKQVLPGT